MYPFSDIIEKVAGGGWVSRIGGLWGASKAFFISTLFDKTDRPIVIITPTNEVTESLSSDLHFFSPWFVSRPRIFSFPFREILPYDTISPHPDIIHERMSTCRALFDGSRGIFLVPIYSIMQRLIPCNELKEEILKVNTGMMIEMDHLISHLVKIGFEPSDVVLKRGTYSLRGGIVDLFSPGEDAPVRIEFFGDVIDSIRTFDPETQRSVKRKDASIIMPAREFSASYSNSFFDYLPQESIVVFDEIKDIAKNSREYWGQIWESYEQIIEQGRGAAEPQELYLSWEEISKLRSVFRSTIEVEFLPMEGTPSIHVSSTTDLFLDAVRDASPMMAIAKRLDSLRKPHALILVSPTEGQAARLRDVLQEYDVPATLTKPEEVMTLITMEERRQPLPVLILPGLLSSGFLYPEASLLLVTEEEIFGKRTKRRPPTKQKARSFLTSFQDIRPGDYVVHVYYGVGQYDGLVRKAFSGGEGDFLRIRYAAGDCIYVPVDTMDLVQKYIGAEGHALHIDRLQGSRWEKTKRRVQKAIEDIATDLVELYAARRVTDGFAYSQDNYLLKEFETSFEYEETPDQLAAIEEVKSDLESRKPMDRLICGDVGYGKTEVALRASCKVILDGKQVALLVPTTLLAQQHYQTFSQRFTSFPVRVEMLSRFRTQQEQKVIIKALADGAVDVIIGTHRLLQKDISFLNLGLVIVDEEQRFGVTQKEQLKQLRKTVDVLALSATPIPRTLQMALMSIRDLSIIETPPDDRLSIHTIIAPFDRRIIRTAVLREFARGGSVFFVHNRVDSIESIATLLHDLMPEARLGVAHGQMSERLLETTMIRFIKGDCNLLVCSAIIESGLDIPSANTIIINRADLFGLADLYQLRGRVGRSGHQAYAYFLVPGEDSLSQDAKKRIKAIQELTELGAGFRLATKDLEIRGAGNLLGRHQSGHITAVGFELYNQMLEKAVKKLQGERVEDDFNPTLNLRMSAFIPEDYIEDSTQRLSFYKRFASLKEKVDLVSLREEMIDRYGHIPVQVENLLRIIEIKLLARAAMVSRIESGEDGIFFTVAPQGKIRGDILQTLISKYPGQLRFIHDYTFLLLVTSKDPLCLFSEIRNCLNVLMGCV